MIKYIHLNYVLRFIREEEGIEFQIVDSRDFGITGVTSFKVIIPKNFKVDKMKITEDFDECSVYQISVLDTDGNNAMEGPNVLLWNSELYSTENEDSVCIADIDIDNGILLFVNFKRISEFVDSKEIIKYM